MPLAPPLPPTANCLSRHQDNRVQLPFGIVYPPTADVISHFVVHIDRALLQKQLPELWKTKMLTFSFDNSLQPITFNEVWVMANLMAPQEIKFYEDRIDLPLFPDFVHLADASRRSRFEILLFSDINDLADMIHISAQQTFLTQFMGQYLVGTRQVVPWTLPSDRGTTLYVSDENVKLEEYRVFLEPFRAFFDIKYIQNERLQNENPFGTNVRTLAIQKRDWAEEEKKVQNLFQPNKCSIQFTRTKQVQSASVELDKYEIPKPDNATCTIWSLKDKEMHYFSSRCGTTFV